MRIFELYLLLIWRNWSKIYSISNYELLEVILHLKRFKMS